MESIFIEATEDSPAVILNKDHSTFIIANRSFPEDAYGFYEPIIEWIEKYVHSPNERTIFEFKLDYYNTSSSKQIFKILLLLEELSKHKDVLIRWHYRKDDTDMLSSGEIFSKLVNLEFQVIEY